MSNAWLGLQSGQGICFAVQAPCGAGLSGCSEHIHFASRQRLQPNTGAICGRLSGTGSRWKREPGTWPKPSQRFAVAQHSKAPAFRCLFLQRGSDAQINTTKHKSPI